MIRRVRSLPPDAGLPRSMLGIGAASRLQFSDLSGAELDAALEEMMQALQMRAAKLDDHVEGLRKLVAIHDPGQLIPSIAVPIQMGLIGDQAGEDDAQLTYSWDAKIEYLVGLAVAGPPGATDVDEEVTTRTIDLLAAVFDSAGAQLFVQSSSESKSDRGGLDAASFLIRQERLLDRMAGYAVHLERIASEVFDPHRAFYLSELGFCPSDAVRLVRLHNKWVNQEFNDRRNEVFDILLSGRPNEDALQDFERMNTTMEAIYLWTPSLLAASTNLPIDEIQSLLAAMSTEFGSQPDFRTPFDENGVRRRPLVALAGDSFLAPTPWSVAHGIHEWIQGYISEQPKSPVAKRYWKHRSDAAERLVQQSYSKVFDLVAVLGNQHYDGQEGHGEIDCVVTLATPILTEVKSHSLTDQGRRGHRPRLSRVANEVVTTSFDQTRRAREYIDNGGRSFADQEGGEPEIRLPVLLGSPVEVVVTLERMDPLAVESNQLAGDSHDGGVWVTNLSDFLMVCDLLDDPAGFLHYAQTRASLHKSGIQIYVESDALGAYFNDRLDRLTPGSALSEDGESVPVPLGYNSTAVNRFFTMEEIGLAADRPATGVPDAIVVGLARCCTNDLAWASVAAAVMATEPSAWKRWRRFVRKHRNGHPFMLQAGSAAVVMVSASAEPTIRSQPVPTLVIPARSLG